MKEHPRIEYNKFIKKLHKEERVKKEMREKLARLMKDVEDWKKEEK
jgi:hypothetical protein